jgi:hypothetical protein
MARACLAFVVLVSVCVTAAAQEKTKRKQRTEEINRLAKELKGTPNKKYEGTTVDIETDELAINVAWAEPNSWEPAIGESLHQALITEKRPAVVLLRTKNDDRLVERCRAVCRSVGIRLILHDLTTHKLEDGYIPSAEELTAMGRATKPGKELFDLRVQVWQAKSGIDVLLVSTLPGVDSALVVREINQFREYGVIAVSVLPLVLKTKPETNRVLRTAMDSIRAEARDARLTLTASIPNEFLAAAADVGNAARKFSKGLLGEE